MIDVTISTEEVVMPLSGEPAVWFSHFVLLNVCQVTEWRKNESAMRNFEWGIFVFHAPSAHLWTFLSYKP